MRVLTISILVLTAICVGSAVLSVSSARGAGLSASAMSSMLQQTKLTAADGAAGDHFGHSVALSDDGTTAAIGVPDDTIGSTASMGSVYVFVRVDGAWSLQQKLTPSDGGHVDQFGSAVALSADGNILVVGSMRADVVSAADDRGAAYVFMRSGSTWSQWQKLSAPDATEYSYAGEEVAVSYDAGTIAIGGDHHSTGNPGNQGGVFVFYRGPFNLFWSQQQTLTAADGQPGDYLGSSVALSSDGSTLVSGAWGDDFGTTSEQGSVYVFVRSGSTWSQSQKLTAYDGQASDRFGNAVALSGDGLIATVGAYWDGTGSSVAHGSVYMFERVSGIWTWQQKLNASDAASDDEFGFRVGLCRNGNFLIVGALRADAPLQDQGAAYTFTLANATWTEQHKLVDSNPHDDVYLGNAVAASTNGDTALVGVAYDWVGTNGNQGSAIVYTLHRDTLFVPLTPCRVFDTRVSSGPEAGAPVIDAGARRIFYVAGTCGVPVDARAISANLTVVGATASGDLRVTAGHLPTTLTSALSVPLTRARANNAMIQLSNDGLGSIAATNDTAGQLHLILDVNGYFR
jgi:hypothetical protein